jgi:uncharacterized UPF0160 family protein
MITIINPDTPKGLQHKKPRDITVVTHDGLFHSDEVFSIALLKLFHRNINIMRTRDQEILKQAINNPDIYVLDSGGDYNPRKRNFDHHQDETPEQLSTIAILFHHLFPGYPNDGMMMKLYDRLINGINAWDQGKIDRNAEDAPLYLPQLISAFNRYGTSEQDFQFIKAVQFAEQIIANEMNTAKELLRAEAIWEKRTFPVPNVALLDQHCVFWRIVQGRNPQTPFIIQPSGKNWSVVSVDSVAHPLPSVPDNIDSVFEHKDRFIIIFKELPTALYYADKLLSGYDSKTLTHTKNKNPLEVG